MENHEIGLLAEKIGQAAAKAGRTYVVLIAGGSASGKTFLAKRLKEELGKRATLLSADDYYKGVSYIRREAAKGNLLCLDQPEVVDLEMFAEHIGQLTAGKLVHKPCYDFNTGERTYWTYVSPSEIILVEGLFILDEPVVSLGDFKIFCAAGTHGRLIRRLLRDVERTSWKPGDILRYFAEVVEPMHHKYIEATKANADLVVDSEYRPVAESGRAGSHERQIKFRLDLPVAPAAVPELVVSRRHVRSIDPANKSREQMDHYYNPPDRELANTGELVRVRQENGVRLLTYKGPQSPTTGKRPRFECELDEAAEAAVRILYGGRIKSIAKLRRLYRYYGRLVFSLDMLLEPGFPQFLEFRLETDEDEKAMKYFLKDLGLNPGDAIVKSYIELF